MPIDVATWIEPMPEADNPLVLLSNCTLLAFLNARKWPYPVVERLEALVSIITSMNFAEVSER